MKKILVLGLLFLCSTTVLQADDTLLYSLKAEQSNEYVIIVKSETNGQLAALHGWPGRMHPVEIEVLDSDEHMFTAYLGGYENLLSLYPSHSEFQASLSRTSDTGITYLTNVEPTKTLFEKLGIGLNHGKIDLSADSTKCFQLLSSAL